MDLKKAMATNVRRARHSTELTQEELADRAGLSARYLGRLAQALGVDPCDLIQTLPRRQRPSQ